MAEGTSLLRMHRAYTSIVGSNPTVSAKTLFSIVLDRQKTRSSPMRLRVFCSVLSCIVLVDSEFLGALFGARSTTDEAASPQNHA